MDKEFMRTFPLDDPLDSVRSWCCRSHMANSAYGHLIWITLLVALLGSLRCHPVYADQMGSGEGVAAAFSEQVTTPQFGDLPQMIERRRIRVLVPYSWTHYFVADGVQRGITYEQLVALEAWLNKKRNPKEKISIVTIPVTRDRLLAWLKDGRGDIAAGNITITAKRDQMIDFTDPLSDDISELVVTGPSAPELKSIDDLSGQAVYVRASSSYAESLEALNTRFTAEGKLPVKINFVNEYLETEDILQMVDAGLIGITISDSDLAHFWSKILERIRVHEDLAIASERQLAWAVREDSPELRKQLNAFVKTVRTGSEIGNVLLARYLKKTDYVKDSLADSDQRRFNDVHKIFETYAPRYGLDSLLMTAQGYQESGLDQNKRSRVGAIGIMQLMPATARDKAVAIPDIHVAESNVHAGIKYVRFLEDQYFADPAIDSLNRALFALAAYNAGPNRIRQLRGQAAQAGLDPTVWFGSVEYVVARRVGREPVTYVSNIFKYYVAYQASEALLQERKDVKSGAVGR